jgi:hypothetical protein
MTVSHLHGFGDAEVKQPNCIFQIKLAQRRSVLLTTKLAFIHTVPSLVSLFTDLSKEILPGDVEIYHIADEVLLKVVLAQGGLSPSFFAGWQKTL